MRSGDQLRMRSGLQSLKLCSDCARLWGNFDDELNAFFLLGQWRSAGEMPPYKFQYLNVLSPVGRAPCGRFRFGS